MAISCSSLPAIYLPAVIVRDKNKSSAGVQDLIIYIMRLIRTNTSDPNCALQLKQPGLHNVNLTQQGRILQ